MDRKELVKIENDSIKRFIETNSQYIKGRVLDFGAGHMPFKEYIMSLEDVTMYVAYDSMDYPASRAIAGSKYETDLNKLRGTFNTIVCTQVLQYTLDPARIISDIYSLLTENGHALVSYPTTWDEVEEEDFLRFTEAGTKRLFERQGFVTIKNYKRFMLHIGGSGSDSVDFSLGGGYVGRVK